jgi:hypothetical protein
MPLAFALGDVDGVGLPGVVGDDLVPVGRREHLPLRARRRGEPGGGVVEVADEAGGPAKLAVTVQQTETAGPADGAGHEGQDLPATLVDAERAGRAAEPDRVQMGEQRVHGRRPGPGRRLRVGLAGAPGRMAGQAELLDGTHRDYMSPTGMISYTSMDPPPGMASCG